MFGAAVWLAVLAGLGGGDEIFAAHAREGAVPACLTSWAFSPDEAAPKPAAPPAWQKVGDAAPALRLRAARARAPAAR
jgi:hypothetical protein